MQRLRRLRMMLTKVLFSNRECAVIERFGLLVLALLSIEICQAGEWFRQIRMVQSQRLLPDGERSQVERMVGGEIALSTANSELYVTVARYTAPQSMVI